MNIRHHFSANGIKSVRTRRQIGQLLAEGLAVDAIAARLGLERGYVPIAEREPRFLEPARCELCGAELTGVLSCCAADRGVLCPGCLAAAPVPFGRLMVSCRLLRGMPLGALNELAAASGLPAERIKRIELGRHDPVWTDAAVLLRALGVKLVLGE